MTPQSGIRSACKGASSTRFSVSLRAKWGVFRVLEYLSESRAPVPGGRDRYAETREASGERNVRSLWVFASTIGELNAIEPLLREVIRRVPGYGLTLLSDHPHYEEGFLRKYPAATFCVIDHRSALIRDLIARHAPALLLLAEIPCLLSEAPCRFPFAAVLEAKRHGALACLVNGWLYGQRPSSRLDAVEKALFDRDYLQLFDALAVQTQEVRRTLIGAGAPPD